MPDLPEDVRQQLRDLAYDAVSRTADIEYVDDRQSVADEVVEALWPIAVTEGRRQAAEVRAVPDDLIGDGPCHDCGAVNIRWYADSPLWNRVMGGPGARDDPGGIVCIHCFVKRADAAGFNPPAWRLSLPGDPSTEGGTVG